MLWSMANRDPATTPTPLAMAMEDCHKAAKEPATTPLAANPKHWSAPGIHARSTRPRIKSIHSTVWCVPPGLADPTVIEEFNTLTAVMLTCSMMLNCSKLGNLRLVCLQIPRNKCMVDVRKSRGLVRIKNPDDHWCMTTSTRSKGHISPWKHNCSYCLACPVPARSRYMVDVGKFAMVWIFRTPNDGAWPQAQGSLTCRRALVALAI